MEGTTGRQMDGLADFVFGLAPDAIPDAARDAAALMCLDTLGVIAAATPMQAGVIARDTACALYGTADPSYRARLMFDGRITGCAGAAFAAATQADNLDAHDGFAPAKGHIGVAVIPALVALAEQLPDLDGAEALTLITIGYEVAGRAALSLHASVSDYHTSGAWNALGAAAVGARMRQLGPARLRHALGIAEYHGPRSQMMREIANPTMLHDGSGWGVLAGLSALVLAEKGFEGAPAITVEDQAAAPFWADLGQHWIMQRQFVKPYPVCRWAHAPIDGVRELMAAHALRHDDIAAIRVRSFREAVCLFQGMPDTPSKAQYSMSFAIAVQAIHGRIGLEHISGAGLSDPRVAAMIGRISVEESDIHNATFPQGRDADVQMALADGRVLETGTVHARGGPERPMPQADVIAKYHEFADGCLGAERAAAIRDAVLALAAPGARFADVTRHLFAPPGG